MKRHARRNRLPRRMPPCRCSPTSARTNGCTIWDPRRREKARYNQQQAGAIRVKVEATVQLGGKIHVLVQQTTDMETSKQKAGEGARDLWTTVFISSHQMPGQMGLQHST